MLPCVVERPGAKRGESDRPVCNASEACVSVVRVTRPLLGVGQGDAEPFTIRRRPWKTFLFQERALRNPPA
jgi:hypothetical protein